MDSTSSAPPTPSRIHFAVLGVVALVAVGYGWFIYQHCAPYAGGSDSAGYLNSARLLAHGQVSEPVRIVPGLVPPNWNYALYQPLGCNVDNQTGRLVPSYPVGLPLHYMIAAALVGFEKAVRVVNALNALAAGTLLYALGRQLGLARRWSLAAVALLWACPVWIYQSLQPMSDSVATTWSVAAILCALRGRERTGWAAVAGVAFAVAVLVRPTSVVLLAPLAVALGGRWRTWCAFALGGLPFALGLGAYNYSAYGNAFASGYNYNGANVLTGGFGWQFFRGNLAHFAVWIPQLLSPPIVILAVLGLPWVIRQAPPPRLAPGRLDYRVHRPLLVLFLRGQNLVVPSLSAAGISRGHPRRVAGTANFLRPAARKGGLAGAGRARAGRPGLPVHSDQPVARGGDPRERASLLGREHVAEPACPAGCHPAHLAAERVRPVLQHAADRALGFYQSERIRPALPDRRRPAPADLCAAVWLRESRNAKKARRQVVRHRARRRRVDLAPGRARDNRGGPVSASSMTARRRAPVFALYDARLLLPEP